MAKRRGREFFEVFRPAEPPKGQRPLGEHSGGDVPSVNRESALAPPPAGGGKGGGGQTVYRLSRSAVGVLLLVVIVLLTLSHVWGFYRGRSQAHAMRLPADAALPDEDPKVPVGEPEDQAGSPPAPAERAYMLCIASYDTRAGAQRLIERLREEFGDKFDEQFEFHYINVTGRSPHAVAVGPLPSSRSEDAQRLKRRIQSMDFRGERRPFESAYYVQIVQQ